MTANNSYTPEQIEFLREHRPLMSSPDLTNAFNQKFGLSLSRTAIESTCKILHISTGRSGRFQSGNVPFNKGQKGVRHSLQTEFKPGNRPANSVPVGTEIERQGGYLWVKIAEPNKWRQKHVLIWEAANGPLPKGQIVIFLDSNIKNLNPSNLQLVTRSELLKLNINQYSTLEGDLKPVVFNLSKLQAKCHIKP